MLLKTTIAAPLVALALSCLAACSGSAPYPDRALYTLNPGTPDQVHAKPINDITLRVRRIVAVPPYGGTSFVTRSAANRIAIDYYNSFAASPSDLVTGELVQWLKSTNTFAVVTDGSGGMTHQWALEGRLQDLAVDATNPAAPEAVLTLELVLLDDSGAVPRRLMEKTYTERCPIPSATPRAAAEGWSKACHNAFEKFSADLDKIGNP